MRPRIGIRELRDTLTTTIRRVRNGETLEIRTTAFRLRSSPHYPTTESSSWWPAAR